MFVLLGLGSNVENRARHLCAGIKALGSVGRVRAQSPVYQTAPMYVTDQPAFLNMAVVFETECVPLDLLRAAKRIEAAEGRDLSPQAQRYGARPLDIDLLFVTADWPTAIATPLVLDTVALTLPHPRLAERAFVLAPLRDLAPDLCDPITGRAIRELAAKVDDQDVERLGPLSALL